MDEARPANVGIPPRRSIHLFDLDDTLIRTSARVLVRDEAGNLLRALSTGEFTGYRAGPGEVFDFAEFSDLGILSRGIVVRYTRAIIDTILAYGTRSEFGILTARADKKMHAPFLIRLFRSLFGVRLANEFIFAVSDLRFSGYKDKRVGPGGAPFSKLSVSQRKALVIAEDLVGRGFNDISFYDDCRANLESFKVMREAFPNVTYRPHFIDPTWSARLEEFLASPADRKTLIKGAGSVRILLEHHSRRAGDAEAALRGLQSGTPLRLDTMPVWICYQDGKYSLRKSPAVSGIEPGNPVIAAD
jgi:hypothetical protein